MREGTDVFERLRSTNRLPSPPGVAMRVLELARADDVSMIEVAEVISSDPVLSARMLKFINSALVGLSQQVSSLKHAVMLMGLRGVKMLSLSFSVPTLNTVRACPSFDHERFWSRSLACAVAARTIADKINNEAPEEAFVAGLLSRIGQLALAHGLSNEYDQVIRTALKEACDLAAAERRVIGMTHTEIGARLLEEWQLPEQLCDAIAQFPSAAEIEPGEDGITPLAYILYAADLAASTLCDDKEQIARRFGEAVIAVEKHFAIDRTEWVNMLGMIAQQWKEYCQLLAIKVPDVKSVSEIEADAREQIVELSLAAQLQNELTDQKDD